MSEIMLTQEEQKNKKNNKQNYKNHSHGCHCKNNKLKQEEKK